MTYLPTPDKTEDGERKVRSSDDRLRNLLISIDAKLAIIAHQLSLLTKEEVTEKDL